MRLAPLARFCCSAVLTLASAAPLSSQVENQTARSYPWQYYWQQSLAAHRRKDHAGFLTAAADAMRLGPRGHSVLTYNLARAHSLNGNTAEAARLLAAVLDMGFGADAGEGADFEPLRGSAEFKSLLPRIERLRRPVVRGRRAFTIPERDLIPEGIAYDPVGKRFYVGSLYKAKIVSLDRNGLRRDFTAEGQDGLFGVLGMKVDARRRVLWVSTSVVREMRGFDKSAEGRAALHAYDLNSGRLIKKYAVGGGESRHLLNDLALGPAGQVFVTDSLQSAIYRLSPGEEELELFVRLRPHTYPNGIALSGDGARLFVAHLEGISAVELATRKVSDLAHPPGVALNGIDGLYYHRGSLIAVQNSAGEPARVARFPLAERETRVGRVQVIESNHPLFNVPTTGVVVGSAFYYLANSQLGSFDPQGKIFPTEKLGDVFILRVNL